MWCFVSICWEQLWMEKKIEVYCYQCSVLYWTIKPIKYRCVSPQRECSSMAYQRVGSNKTGATSGAGTASSFRVHEFNSGLYQSSCCSIISFLCSILYIIVCHFVPFLAVLSFLLRFTAADNPTGIFKLFTIYLFSPFSAFSDFSFCD